MNMGSFYMIDPEDNKIGLWEPIDSFLQKTKTKRQNN